MTEFESAIAWRGIRHRSFIAYGIWQRPGIDDLATELAEELAGVEPGSQISSFVAADEDWPCVVGVFDVEVSKWPNEPEQFCRDLLGGLCRRGARLGWMMFEGVFNEIGDIFSDSWAPHIYAIGPDCGTGRVRVGIADEVRHSPEWKEFVLGCRRQLLAEYPGLDRA
jgi:hypothetical protein